MSFANDLKDKVLNKYQISKEDALKLCSEDLEELCYCANEIRKSFCGDYFDMCTIVNGKSGKCSEDCKFCAQSCFYKTKVKEHGLVSQKDLEQQALYNQDKGVLRYSVVTSGRNLLDNEINYLCKFYNDFSKKHTISLCASHGLLTYSQFEKLKKAGVTRIHNNLETSRRNFSNICSTHTYDDKIQAIKNAKKAGLEVCSGGIMGIGETMEDRIDMAIDLRSLGIRSIPVNVLSPIKGTPFENLSKLSIDEIRKIVAIYRFILPNSAIRMAGGRGLMNDKGKAVFLSGANSAITGDMLTTYGISIDEDKKILNNLGFKIQRI